MSKPPKEVSREIGLEIGVIWGKHFLKSRYLHYGYWPSELEVDVANLRAAQENYAVFLVSHIPDGVKTILDVGCGTGEMAKRLVDMGYQVDCVSPSPFLSKQARERLGSASCIFECFYEELQTENRYDLILFSESFQYIDPEGAVEKTFGLLNKDGHILICDIFKKDALGKSPLPGGHPLRGFYDIVSGYPLQLVEDVDITEQTAPTLDVMNNMVKEVVEPTVNLAQQLLDDRHPFASRFLKWMYRDKIKKINKKYFSGEKTGENFKKFKSYRLLLYKKIDLQESWQLDFGDDCPGGVQSELEETIKVGAITALANSNCFCRILNYLIKWRTLVLTTAFLIMIVENIIDGEKPHELEFPDISVRAGIGLILVIFGVFIRIWTRGHFEKRCLTTTGPYAIVRHPLYLGSLLVVVGVLFQLNDWFNWAVVLSLFAIFYGAAIIHEERSLEKKFGRQWRLYKAKTPAIIPSLRIRSLRNRTREWSWRAYFSTPEPIVTPMLLCLPLIIELIEDLVFEGMLGV
jgi:protein-S-isoprenylcysteine O-methyltransferase Ste14/SAM-dependent methyltransferase